MKTISSIAEQKKRQSAWLFLDYLKLSILIAPIYSLIRLILEIVNAVFPFLLLIGSKNIINMITAHNNQVLSYLILFAILSIVQIIIQRFLSYIQETHNEKVTVIVNNIFSEKCLNLSIDYFDIVDKQNALQNARSNSNTIITLLWDFYEIIKYSTVLIYSFYVVYLVNPLYSLLIILSQLPYSIISLAISSEKYKWMINNVKTYREYNYYQKIPTEKRYAFDIHALRLEEYIKNKIESIGQKIYLAKSKMLTKHLLVILPVVFLPEMAQLFITYHLILKCLSSTIEVGDFILYSGMISALSSSILSLLLQADTINKDRIKIEAIYGFLAIDNSVKDCGTTELNDIQSIKFEHVYFKYPNSKDYILKNLSFEIKEKEHVCITGINGCGKSTIIKLLLRFYDCDKGIIYINGIRIEKYKISDLRAAIGVVFQENVLFSTTIYNNIVFGDLSKKDNINDIINSMHLADADLILEKVRLDTELFRLFSDEGFEPSLGECQKLCIARCIYRDKNVWIMDEPSSSIDPISERRLINNLKSIIPDKTVIFTAHRLSTTVLSDRIMVLNNGCIVENGTFNELLEKQGLFYEMYNNQMKKSLFCT